jgi:hypothetical protein
MASTESMIGQQALLDVQESLQSIEKALLEAKIVDLGAYSERLQLQIKDAEKQNGYLQFQLNWFWENEAKVEAEMRLKDRQIKELSLRLNKAKASKAKINKSYLALKERHDKALGTLDLIRRLLKKLPVKANKPELVAAMIEIRGVLYDLFTEMKKIKTK